MGQSFRDLEVWKRAIELTFVIYNLTTAFPSSERFGLTNQLRRAAVSVASNIAEGSGRATRGEYIQFLGHSRESIFEVVTQLVIAKGLNFGDKKASQHAEELCSEVGRMLRAMIKALQSRPST